MAKLAGAAEYTDCISPNKCPGYDTKQSDSETPITLELWVMQHTHLLPSHPGPLWPGVEASYRVLSMGQNRIKL